MKVVLDKIKSEDAELVAKWKSDPILSEGIMSDFNTTTVEQAREWIGINSNDPNQRLFGISFETESNKVLLGIARLMFIDFETGVAEFGIYIGENNYRNMGVGKKALDRALEIGFIELNLNKIFLKVNAKNTPAINLYNSRKFIIEGRLKEHYWNASEFEDVLYMAIFKAGYL